MAIAALLGAMSTAAPMHTAQAATRAPRVSTPARDPSSEANVLTGVSAVSSMDAWAVGSYCVSDCFDQEFTQELTKTLILHWNGTNWSRVTSPNPGGVNRLEAVSADSSADAWAVGGMLTLHWDGMRWSQIATPGGTGGSLQGVSAVSRTDAWAVGSYRNGTSQRDETLILHWDGMRWSRVRSPNPRPAYDHYLSDVSADSATDAWAVGYSSSRIRSTIITLHWDGTSWSKVKDRKPRRAGKGLSGVSALSPTDAWAVGGHRGKILTLHWDGTRWSKVRNRNPRGGSVDAVSAVSGSDAWAVGKYFTPPGDPITLTLHWDGTSWSKVGSPTPPSDWVVLDDVSAVSANDAWAVGYYDGDIYRTLILHWDGTSWRIV